MTMSSCRNNQVRGDRAGQPNNRLDQGGSVGVAKVGCDLCCDLLQDRIDAIHLGVARMSEALMRLSERIDDIALQIPDTGSEVDMAECGQELGDEPDQMDLTAREIDSMTEEDVDLAALDAAGVPDSGVGLADREVVGWIEEDEDLVALEESVMPSKEVGRPAREDMMTADQKGLSVQEDEILTADLKAPLAELSKIMPRVHDATDQANELVARVEQHLVNDLGLEISARVYLGDGRCLVFGPIEDEFLEVEYRIHVVDQGAFQERLVEWSACSQEVKLRACEKLPDLLEKLNREADRRTGATETAACRLKEMIDDEE
jgi:hypothetical protein